MKDDDVILCNCAGCSRTLLGDKMRGLVIPLRYRDYQFLAGRCNGRPYCSDCLHVIWNRSRGVGGSGNGY